MTLKVIGINDEVTTCECCGRQNLKRTVVLSSGDGERRYGTECAARALGLDRLAVERQVRSAQKKATEEAIAAERRRQWEAEQRYDAWRLATYGDLAHSMDRVRAYRAVGGTF